MNTNYRYWKPVTVTVVTSETILGLCCSEVKFQLPQNTSIQLFYWSSSALLLLLAVMSVLAAADCTRDHMLPSRSHLENQNGLGRWVLHSLALDDHTTAPHCQPLPVNGCGSWMQGGERSNQMLGKHELNGPSHP